MISTIAETFFVFVFLDGRFRWVRTNAGFRREEKQAGLTTILQLVVGQRVASLPLLALDTDLVTKMQNTAKH